MRIELILTSNELLILQSIIRYAREDADILAHSCCITDIDKQFYQLEVDCCKKVGHYLDLALAHTNLK